MVFFLTIHAFDNAGRMCSKWQVVWRGSYDAAAQRAIEIVLEEYPRSLGFYGHATSDLEEIDKEFIAKVLPEARTLAEIAGDAKEDS